MLVLYGTVCDELLPVSSDALTQVISNVAASDGALVNDKALVRDHALGFDTTVALSKRQAVAR